MNVLYTLPFKGRNRITSAYGPRVVNGARDVHQGFDIVAEGSAEVGAPCPGTVKSSTMVTDYRDLTWQWGNYVKLRDGNGRDIFLCHMANRAVAVGWKVDAGDTLGVMGNTGYSFGAHTHWEARTPSGATVDPGELFGLVNLAGVTYDREAMDRACIGYLDCTEDDYRWRTGAGTSCALYKPANTGVCLYCRKGVRYRVYAVAALPGGEVWCQITPPLACQTAGAAPELWVSAACGQYMAKEVFAEQAPEPAPETEDKPVDWASPCNEFIISATGADRVKLRTLCEQLALPVKNL